MSSTSESITFISTAGVSTVSGVYALNNLHDYESLIMLAISVVGAVVSVVALLYTIWKGERSHRLQLMQFEQNRKMLEKANGHSKST